MISKTINMLAVGALSVTFMAGIAQAYSPGDLDQSFGAGGSTVVAITPRTDQAYAVAIQADGKAVVTGYSDSGTDDDFAVVRFNLDGTLDASFGSNGIVTTDFGSTYDEPYAMAIQPDGRIIVAGGRWGQSDDVVVARYNTDGSLDNSFDQDGKVFIPITASGVASAIQVRPSGEILLAGTADNGNDDDIFLIQLNPDGSLDSDFDGDGKLVMSIGQGNDRARAMILQPDGKAIVAGYTDNGNSWDVVLARVDSQGTLDQNFGNGGLVVQSFGSFDDDARGLALMGDGSIVLVGSTDVSWGSSRIFVARFQSQGSPDPSFGVNGIVTVSSPQAIEDGNGVVIQSDNRIVVAGSSLDNRSQIALLRLMADGSLDASFGDGGRIFVEIGDLEDHANAVALQPNGGIVVAGSSRNNVTGTDYAIARFHQQSAPTTSTTVPAPPTTTTLAPVAAAALTPAPSPLTYRAANKKVTLRWRAVEGAASYVVTTTGGAQRCDTTATSCVVPRLRNGKAYTYLVYSVNTDGVRSETATRVSARPGFVVKRTSLKAKRTLKLSSIVTTKSKGAKTWRVTSGGCRIRGDRLVAPTKRGTCRLRLATTKRGSYPAMSTTIKLTITG